MATGSGKTVVMAMLIAWQTLNKQYAPRDVAVHQPVPHRRAGHHHPRPPSRAAARGRGELLRPARPGAGRPQGRPRQRAHRDHELPLLPAQGRQGDQGRRQEHAPAAQGRPRRRPVQGDAAGDGQPGPAGPGRGQAADHGAQRRGAPLLPRHAAIQTGEKASQGAERTRTKRPASGSPACRRSPSTSASSRSATCRRRRSTCPAPATTRATSSRGPSATSR